MRAARLVTVTWSGKNSPPQFTNVLVTYMPQDTATQGLLSNNPPLLEAAQYELCAGELVIRADHLNRLTDTLRKDRRTQPHDWHLTTDPLTSASELRGSKRERATEDRAAVGGLRNPRQSVAGNPAALLVGGRIKRILETVYANTTANFDTIGREAVPTEMTKGAEQTRRLLCQEFGVEIDERQVQAPLIQAIASQSADADTEVPR